MFKHALLRKMKTAAVIAIAAAVLFGVRAILIGQSKIGVSEETGAQPHHEALTNDRLKRVESAGPILAAENAKLALTIDPKDGNIEVLDKAAGYVWRSKPVKEEADQDPANNLWKNNLQSPIIVEYVKSYTETVPTFATAFTPNTKVTVYELPGGARAYYDFAGIGIKLAVDYYLHEDHLEVEVPHYMIEEPADVYTTDEQGAAELDGDKFRKIVAYSVLPFFGAVQGGTVPEGYLMVPDGPGALIRFDGNKTYNLNFTGTVYGRDLSYANRFDSSLSDGLEEPRVFYPAFGLNRGGHSLLAVIHSGESGAEIVGSPAGVNTSFYNAYAQFKFREKYKKLTDLTGAGVFLYSEFSVNVTRNIKYYFLNGTKSDYAGMAEAYRNYLMAEKGLTKKAAREDGLPLELRIMGGVEKDGFLASSFLPMTTFRQASDMLGYFQQHGVRGMTVVYEGWAKGGKSVRYPDRFPAAAGLGGMKELKQLIDQAHRYGYKILLEDDHMRAQSGKGISERKDIVRNIQNAPLDIGEEGRVQVLNPDAISRFLDRSVSEYRELHADGVQERGLGSLNTDFNPARPVNREQIKNKYEAFVAGMAEELGDVRLWRGMAFQLKDGVSIEDAAGEYSFSPVVDEIVPFYQMALHGLADYVSVPYNRMDEPERELLKAVEYGANVSFSLTAEPTERLKDTPLAGLYSSEFGIWREDVLRLYRKVSDALGGVSGSFMTGHEKLARDVYRTTYENGTAIVCNYSDAPYEYEGKTVAAMDFIAVKGRDGH